MDPRSRELKLRQENSLVIIPARTGSRRVPNKNFRPFAGGSSLLSRTVKFALEAGFPEVLVTADCPPPPWWDSASRHASWLTRPSSLAQDDTPMLPVIIHAMAIKPRADHIILLQPTQPFRRMPYLNVALEQLDNCDSVTSVVEEADGWFIRDGSFYCFWRQTVELFGNIYGNARGYAVIPSEHSININTPEDWQRAEAAWKD